MQSVSNTYCIFLFPETTVRIATSAIPTGIATGIAKLKCYHRFTRLEAELTFWWCHNKRTSPPQCMT